MQLIKRKIRFSTLSLVLLALPLVTLLVTAADQQSSSSQNWFLFRGTPLAQGVA